MNYITFVIATMIIVVVITEFILNIMSSKSENSLSGALMSAGITLILSAYPSTLDNLMNLFGISLGEQWATEAVNVWNLFTGVILISLGIFAYFHIRDRVFILNMFGLYSQIEISDKKCIKDLKLSDFKVKEIIIDFVDIFKSGIDDNTNRIIIDKIKKDCQKFKDRSKEFKSCFTGMAPIPYTILAGTYLSDSNTERYFEYKRSQNKYYEIKDRIKKHKYEALAIDYPLCPKIDSKDVVVAISVTKRINKSQLIDWENKDVIEIYLPNPNDNIIESKKQLDEYKMTIVECLEGLGVKYSKLEKIHLVASIPSCVSLEMGKIIALNNNRLKQIITYHYEAQGIKKYPFGIIVTENTSNNKKGKLIKN